MKKIHVTIGIPAHNEEKTIGNLLKDIQDQQVSVAHIDKIIVACDGCTDKTAEIVKKLAKSDKRIQVIDDGKQLRQTGRLEQMYQLNASEVFITFDADTRLGNTLVVEKLALPFSDPRIGLVGGDDKPHAPRNFFESVAVASVDLWDKTRKSLPSYDSVHFIHGCALAIRKKYAQKVHYTNNPVGNDDFLFFTVKSLGGLVSFAPGSTVLYRLPNNLRDYVHQTSRFLNAQELIENTFGKNAYAPYEVSTEVKIRGMVKSVVAEPLRTPLAIALQLYLRLVKSHYSFSAPNWQAVASTKS